MSDPGLDDRFTGIEEVPLERPIHSESRFPSFCCCSCTYHWPTIHELWDKDKRLLRAILAIVVLLNAPIGKYSLYPFVIFSTWIHESFHGLAALSVGGKISWLNIYKDGSGLASTIIPVGKLQRAWVASAGYQGTAVCGGIMLMFRRTNIGARVGTCGMGLAMLLSCILFVRNAFGLAALVTMGVLLVIAGKWLPPFWVGELFALLASTACLNAITSIRVLFFVTESNIGGSVLSSDAMTMQDITMIPSWGWASAWMALAFWMTAMGVFITIDVREKEGGSREELEEFRGEDHPLALSTEMA